MRYAALLLVAWQPVLADISDAGKAILKWTTPNVLVGDLSATGGVATGIRLRTNNADRVMIDGTGNVGIGAAVPASKLDVNGTVAVSGQQALLYEKASKTFMLGDITNSDDAAAGATGDNLAIRTSNHEVARFNTTGYLGLWTTTPKSELEIHDSPLDADGRADLYLVGNTGSGGVLRFFEGTTERATVRGDYTPGDLAFQSGGSSANGPSEQVRITAAGNMGIGTTIPAGKLEVDLNTVATAKEEMLNLLANTKKMVSFMGSDNGLSGYMALYTKDIATPVVQIDARSNPLKNTYFNGGGNFGIGTNIPVYKLDLFGGMRICGSTATDFTAMVLRAGSSGGDKTRIVFSGDNNGDYAQIVGTVTNPTLGVAGNPVAGSLTFRTRNGPQSGDMRDQLTITETGNLIMGGAGTNAILYSLKPTDGSPGTNNGNGSALLIAGGACVNQSSKYGGNLYLRAGSKNLNFGNYGNVAIADDGGNVGIGTDVPASGYKVDVRGNVNISGQVTVASVKTGVWSIAPDYVFGKDYKLASLDHVEKYINENQHLPEIPSAKEMKSGGMDLAEMNLKLLKKVEELTLYAIQQRKRDMKNEMEIRELKTALHMLAKKGNGIE